MSDKTQIGWRDRIFLRQTAGSEFDYDDLAAAASWDTCALGECRRRSGRNMESDMKARYIGIDFLTAVGTNNLNEALELLDKMEELHGLTNKQPEKVEAQNADRKHIKV